MLGRYVSSDECNSCRVSCSSMSNKGSAWFCLSPGWRRSAYSRSSCLTEVNCPAPFRLDVPSRLVTDKVSGGCRDINCECKGDRKRWMELAELAANEQGVFSRI